MVSELEFQSTTEVTTRLTAGGTGTLPTGTRGSAEAHRRKHLRPLG
jgi:hypothetical protein